MAIPRKVFDGALENVSKVPCQEAMEPQRKNQTSERIPFMLMNQPLAIPVKKIIYKNFRILSLDNKAKCIFPPPLSMAFRRDLNLNDTLGRSQLNNANQHPGTTACGCSNCRTCNIQHTEISTAIGRFSVCQVFTCSHLASLLPHLLHTLQEVQDLLHRRDIAIN